MPRPDSRFLRQPDPVAHPAKVGVEGSRNSGPPFGRKFGARVAVAYQPSLRPRETADVRPCRWLRRS